MRTAFKSEPRRGAPRKGLFAHLLEALHRSRRRDAIRVFRQYQHLIARETEIDPVSHPPRPQPTETSSRNADRNSELVHAIRQARRNAGREFA